MRFVYSILYFFFPKRNWYLLFREPGYVLRLYKNTNKKGT